MLLSDAPHNLSVDDQKRADNTEIAGGNNLGEEDELTKTREPKKKRSTPSGSEISNSAAATSQPCPSQ